MDRIQDKQSRTSFVAGLTFVVAGLFAFSCSKLANEELVTGQFGLQLQKVAGDNQTHTPGQIYPKYLTVQLNDRSLGTPVERATINFAAADASCGATILSPVVQTDEKGLASTQIRAPALYDATCRITATADGTNVSTTFTVGTTMTGQGYRFSADTSNGNTETVGVPFGFVVRIVDDQGNTINSVNETRQIIWSFTVRNSWNGTTYALPPSGVWMDCPFVRGVCSLTPDVSPQYSYTLTDAHHETLFSVGDGPGGLVDVYSKQIQVLKKPATQIKLADGRGGPFGLDGVDDDGAGDDTSLYAGNVLTYRTVQQDGTTPAGAQSFYAVQTDEYGNYYGDLTDVTWSMAMALQPPNNLPAPFDGAAAAAPAVNFSISSLAGVSTSFTPSQPGVATLTGTSSSMGAISKTIVVNPGPPQRLYVAAYMPDHSQPLNTVMAGEDFMIFARAIDALGNMAHPDYNPTTGTWDGANGYVGSARAVFKFTGTPNVHKSSGGCPRIKSRLTLPNDGEPWGADVSDMYYKPAYVAACADASLGQSYSAYQTFLVGKSTDDTRGALNDLTSNGAVSRISMVVDPVGVTGQLTGLSNPITVLPGPPHHFSLYSLPLPGFHYCNFNQSIYLYPGIEENTGMRIGNSPTGNYGTDCLADISAGQSRTVYPVREDKGGNLIDNIAVTWITSAPNLVIPVLTIAGDQKSASAYFTLSGSNTIVFTAPAGSLTHPETNYKNSAEVSAGIRALPITKYIMRVENAEHSLGNTVTATSSYSLAMCPADQFDNIIRGMSDRNILVVYSGPGTGNSPKGTSAVFPADAGAPGGGSYHTYDFPLATSCAEVRDLRLVKTGQVTITATDAQGKSGDISFTVQSGPITTVQIRDAANGGGTDRTSMSFNVDADRDASFFINPVDTEGNTVSNVLTTTSWAWTNPGVLTTMNTAGDPTTITWKGTGSGVLSATVSAPSNSGGATSFTPATGTVSVVPGPFSHLELVLSGTNNVTAGTAFTITPRMVDGKNNVLTSASGTFSTSISVLGATKTVYDDSFSGLNGVSDLVYTNGSGPALSYTFYNAADTPMVQIATKGNGTMFRYGSDTFTVAHAAFDHLLYNVAVSTASPAQEITYTLYAKDYWGNTIGDGAAGSAPVTFAFLPALLGGRTIRSTTLANPAYPSGDEVDGNLTNGVASVAVSATEAGTLNVGGSTTVARAGGKPDNFKSVTINANPAIASIDFGVAPPANHVASGTMSGFTVRLKDAFGNVVLSDSTTTVTLSLASGNSAKFSGTLTKTASNGIATFSDINYLKAGDTIRITATESTSGKTVTSGDIVVSAGAATKAIVVINEGAEESFAQGFPSFNAAVTGSIAAKTQDVAIPATVYAVDDAFNIVTTYNGSVNLSSLTESNPTISRTGACSANGGYFANGACTFNIIHRVANTAHQLTPVTALNSVSSHTYAVSVGDARKILILAPGESLLPGSGSGKTGAITTPRVATSFGVEVYATDSNWNVVTADNQTQVTLTFNGAPAGSVTSNSPKTLTNGHASFTVTYYRAFNNENPAPATTYVGATLGNPYYASYAISSSTAFGVTAGDVFQTLVYLPGQTYSPGFSSRANALTGSPSDQTAGTAFNNVIIRAVDSYFNTVNQAGTITLTTSDPNDTDPGSQTLSSGQKSVSVTNYTAGAGYSVTATGMTWGPATVSSDTYTIKPNNKAYTIIVLPGQNYSPGKTNIANVVTGTPDAQTAGTPFNVDLYVTDNYGNRVITEVSTVGFTSNDTQAVGILPGTPAAALVSGARTAVSITPKTAGSNTLTGSGGTLAIGSHRASSNFTVNAASASNLKWASGNTTITQNFCVAYTVLSADAYGNTANVAGATQVDLSSNLAGTFHNDPGCSGTITQTTIGAGGNSSNVYFKPTGSGSYVLTASGVVGANPAASGTKSITVNAAPDRIVLTDSGGSSTSGTLTASGTTCYQITARTRSGASTDSPMPTNTQVNLASADPNVVIYNSACSSTVSSVTITSPASTVTFGVKSTVKGSYTITGSPAAGGLSNGAFTLTVNAASLSSITKVSPAGVPANTVVAHAVSEPPTVVAKDQYNNLITGCSLAFSAPGGGTLGQASVPLDASGQATTGFTVGNTAASYTVSVNPGTCTGSGTVSFSYPAIPDAPFALSFTTQPVANQVDGNNFQVQPVVKVLDKFNNVVTSSATSISLSPYSDPDCGFPLVGGTLNGGGGTVPVSGVATFSGVNYTPPNPSPGANNIYLGASNGTVVGCSGIVTVYDPMSIRVASGSNTTNTAGSGNVRIEAAGGYGARIFSLGTNNSGASLGTPYTGSGCPAGYFCVDYTVGATGGGVADVIQVHDSATAQQAGNSTSLTMTVNGGKLSWTGGVGAYGTQSSDVSHAFMLTNQGNGPAGTIAISLVSCMQDGTGFTCPALGDVTSTIWAATDVNCDGTTGLAASGNCTVNVVFRGSYAGRGTGSFTAKLKATSANGGTVTVDLSGAR